ncbi:MAG: DUF2510 domain-containing protein [Acidobacteriota bacterium]|nr:DUF2510 domain-containing protein [Acidobacteriota bacterium]
MGTDACNPAVAGCKATTSSGSPVLVLVVAAIVVVIVLSIVALAIRVRRRRRSGALPPPATAPGWYPDPSGEGASRYWNGERWTDTPGGD